MYTSKTFHFCYILCLTLVIFCVYNQIRGCIFSCSFPGKNAFSHDNNAQILHCRSNSIKFYHEANQWQQRMKMKNPLILFI